MNTLYSRSTIRSRSSRGWFVTPQAGTCFWSVLIRASLLLLVVSIHLLGIEKPAATSSWPSDCMQMPRLMHIWLKHTKKMRTMFVRNRPNKFTGKFTFLDLMALFRASSLARDCLRLSMPWYCFALTKTGSSTASHCNGTPCCCIPINCNWTWHRDLSEMKQKLQTSE